MCPSMYLHSQPGILIGHSASSSVTADPFRCSVGTNKICKRCRESSDYLVTTIPTLSLSIVGHVSLSECLNSYFTPEELQDVFCDPCTKAAVYAAYGQSGRDIRSPELINLGISGGTDSYMHENITSRSSSGNFWGSWA